MRRETIRDQIDEQKFKRSEYVHLKNHLSTMIWGFSAISISLIILVLAREDSKIPTLIFELFVFMVVSLTLVNIYFSVDKEEKKINDKIKKLYKQLIR